MNRSLYFLSAIIVILFCNVPCAAQVTHDEDTTSYNTDDLEKILRKSGDGSGKSSGYFVSATFKSTRIINGHSIENVGKGVLDFRIAHRFGQLNEGIKNLYGLDNATTKFSFDYGITDWLMAGVGRSSYEKEYDGFFKIKVLRQSIDERYPVGVSVVSGMSVRTLDILNLPGYTYYFNNRLYYFSQLLVARKFNNWLSIQLMPTYIHYNLVTFADEPNDVLAMGVGGRVKLNKRIAITYEYYYTIPGHKLDGHNNPVSVGIDVETGGHVFQLFLTNAANTTERSFIGETTGDINKGAIHLGFNISRVFTVVRSKENKSTGNKVW
jgi:uncharacterized beta barrel domain-containing protein DUF5777